MKLALVHDYLIQDGGAERVLRAFAEVWPEAPIFVLFHDQKRWGKIFKDKDIRTSVLQKLPGVLHYYRWTLPLMPAATEHHDLTEFDVVLSSASAFAKGIVTRPDALHISYCHTPTRYLWTDTHSYIKDLRTNRGIKFLLPFVLTSLRMWDRMSAVRVDKFIANSQTVAKRIEKYYERESDIMHPPVDCSQFYVSKPGNYFLAGGRLVAYKRFDLVIEVFNRLKLPLIIFGTGPYEDRLRAMAGSNVRFVGRVSDKERARLLSECIAFLNPQLEDFGLVPLEAMASGRPVIVYGKGGVMEYVVEGKNGTIFYEQTWEALLDAVVHFKPEQYNPQEIRKWAEQFDLPAFKQRIKNYVEGAYGEFTGGQKRARLL